MVPAPAYVVAGHVSKDLLSPGASIPGGTALYASLTAQALGVPAGLVTALAPADADLLAPARAAGVLCQVRPSPATTTFTPVYDGEARRLRITAQAAALHPRDFPPAWAGARILHLGPVAAEIAAAPTWADRSRAALVGVTPQGWLRSWDATGWIVPSPWAAAGPLLARADVLVLSLEDVGYDQEALMGYVGQ
ncbi:MAG TPA: ribokinase, partial [Chloroflexia bacterium]|nr:ribokinase [Chloroflexia bacterium]